MNKETEAQRLARLDREAGARGRVPKTRDENISGKGWFNRPAQTVPPKAPDA